MNKRNRKYTRKNVNGKYKSVFYVDATINSYLARQCQRVLDKYEVPINVMEKTGKVESICRQKTAMIQNALFVFPAAKSTAESET